MRTVVWKLNRTQHVVMLVCLTFATVNVILALGALRRAVVMKPQTAAADMKFIQTFLSAAGRSIRPAVDVEVPAIAEVAVMQGQGAAFIRSR